MHVCWQLRIGNPLKSLRYLTYDCAYGFVDKDGDAMGRPVGVAMDKQGALLVADDVGNTVWRVTSAAPTAASLQQPAGSAGR